MDCVADGDSSDLQNVRAETAPMDETTKCSGHGQPLEVSAGFAPALSEAGDFSDSEALANQSVEVDAVRNDVATSLFWGESHPASTEFSQGLGFDKGDVLTDPTWVRRKRSGLILVAVAIDSTRARGYGFLRNCVASCARRRHECHNMPDLDASTISN